MCGCIRMLNESASIIFYNDFCDVNIQQEKQLFLFIS